MAPTSVATRASRTQPRQAAHDGDSSSEPTSALPAYAPLLMAFHQEFAEELQAILAGLPLAPGQRVLDVACGDGRYAAWLAQRVGRRGAVTAIDASTAWLATANKTVLAARAANVKLLQADARKLPFASGSFDLVWCAQSLYSLRDVMQCLAEMMRVLRKGGTLAVLEDDTLHHALLPWPIDLELALRTAELTAFRRETVAPARFYVGRWAARLLRKAGLAHVREHASAATRQAPLSRAGRQFFVEYLANLRRRVRPFLTRSFRQRFDRLVDPNSKRYLLRQPDFSAVLLDRVIWGQTTT